MKWTCASYEFDAKMPILMGILNVTPDSFSDGGHYASVEAAVAHAEQMAAEGAAIIDVGGESTRPGADPVDPAEEWRRIGDVVQALVERGLCVSVDTRHAEVAAKAVEAGAAIINDVSGFCDPAMVEVARASDVGCVVMHMKGDPSTMQQLAEYDDVVAEVRDYLAARCAEVGRNLTLDSTYTKPSRELANLWNHQVEMSEVLTSKAAGMSTRETHRAVMLVMSERLLATATRTADIMYRSVDEFLDDLRVVQRSLEEAGARREAYGPLQKLVWQAETFGFSLVEMEFRQHSLVHRRALEDIREHGRWGERGELEPMTL